MTWNVFVKLASDGFFSFLQIFLPNAQPRPHSHPPSVKAPEPAKPAALVDLLSLHTPAPAPVSAPVPAATTSAGLLNSLAQPPAPQPAKTGLENEVMSQNCPSMDVTFHYMALLMHVGRNFKMCWIHSEYFLPLIVIYV